MLRVAKSSNTEAMIPRDIKPTEEQAQKIAEINAGSRKPSSLSDQTK